MITQVGRKQDFWDWYEKNKQGLFWRKYRLILGLDPDGRDWLKENRHWNAVEKVRKECLESTDPARIFEIAHFLDLPYFLEKWWDYLYIQEKEKYLIQTWFMKMDASITGLDWWIPYFNELGYITNCEEPKPIDSLVLYRGAIPHFRKQMSWTTNLDMAKSFAESPSEISNKYVYGTIVQPDDILAIFKGDGVDTDGNVIVDQGLEYVVNHQHLKFDDIYAIDDPEWQKIDKP